MNKNKLSFLKVAIVAVLGVTTALGCEKGQEAVSKNQVYKIENKSDNEVSIDVLKHYFAEKINAKLVWITYDEKTEMFQLHNVNQISRKDLEESYQRNFLKAN